MPQTHTLITTPGAGRVYKARPDKSLQHQMIALHVANDSMMEWLPQETLLYPNAQTRLDTTVYLQGNARFIGWDIACFGLSASQQPFDKGQVNQCFQIHRDDNIVLRERLIINDQYRALLETTTGLQGRSVNGFMVAGPFKHINIDDLLQSLRALSLESSTLIGISLVGDFLTIRSLGVDSEQTKHFFIQCWQHIRPKLLNRPACLPRIWAT
jgi:urease accessory protein